MKKHYWFSFLFFTYYMLFGMLSINLIPFLNDLGYSINERNIMFSALALVGIILQLLIGYICDKYQNIKINVMILITILDIVGILTFTLTTKNFYLHLLYIAVLGGIYRMLFNLLDSWVLECSENITKRYGAIRACGALGFTIGAIGSTYLIERTSYMLIVIVSIILNIILIIITKRCSNPTTKSGMSEVNSADFKALLSNKMYLWLVLIFLLINIVGTADQYTTIDKLIELGANKDALSLKWSIQSICEVPAFLFGTYLLSHFKEYKLLLIGCTLYLLKFFLYGYVSKINLMLLVTFMQICTYPLIMLSARILFAKIAKKSNLKTSAQMIASAIYLGFSGFLSPLICSFLINLFNIDLTLYILSAMLLIPLSLIILKKKEIN